MFSIVGAGLAGSEAAAQLASWGWRVSLYEMRPAQTTEAHHTDQFAELVCSNSFKSTDPVSAPGMLKHELSIGGSLILQKGILHQVPAGGALGVDRDLFSQSVTEDLRSRPEVEFQNECVAVPPSGLTLLATGPLTAPELTQWIQQAAGQTSLYFYDAIAPVVDAQSILWDRVFQANRYDKGGEAAYINCPMDRPQYEAFIAALHAAEKVPPKNFEKEILFQGCQPIESIAASGVDSLRFGPMKPVGLTDPKTGRRPYAAVQLRAENRACSAFNLVGFQTKLKYGEQAKVFRMIPGLESAEFFRFGSMHRNTYVCTPTALQADLSFKSHPQVFLGGQITGVEGYLESTSMGWLAAVNMALRANGLPPEHPPLNTAMGSLWRHVTQSDPKHYVPNNMQFGIMDTTAFDSVDDLPKDLRRQRMAQQAAQSFETWWGRVSQLVKPRLPLENKRHEESLDTARFCHRPDPHRPRGVQLL